MLISFRKTEPRRRIQNNKDITESTIFNEEWSTNRWGGAPILMKLLFQISDITYIACKKRKTFATGKITYKNYCSNRSLNYFMVQNGLRLHESK